MSGTTNLAGKVDSILGRHRLTWLVACLALGCDSTENPGGQTGGANAGGSRANGGAPVAGGTRSTGGTSSGGMATGGSTGGRSSGGSPTGGRATGGTATGGSSGVPTCSGTKGNQLCAASSTTVPSSYITAGKYWINNNWWGTSGVTGSQCMWQTCLSGDTLGWGTSYNWGGATNSVKTYTSVVLGWHYGTIIPNSTTGLPVQLSANRNVTCAWSFTVTQSGTVIQNVSYDLWLHTMATPSYSQAGSDEVMIWLYKSGGAGPAGTRQVQGLSLGGATWDLYEGNVSSWVCHSFVRTANTNSARLNLMEFLQYLVSSRGLSSSKYLTGIEAGTEIFTGTGQLDTNGYTCTIQ